MIGLKPAPCGPETDDSNSIPLQTGFQWHLPDMDTLVDLLEAEILQGLESNVTMLSTLTPVPDSHTHGRVLVLDLGGSTFRLCILELFGEGQYKILCSREWQLDSKEINVSFFQSLVDRVCTATIDRYFPHTVTVGLSICFPFKQTKPNDAYLDVVGKGFILADEIRGKNIALLLQQQLETATKKQVCVKAVINDAVSVYVAGAYLYECRLGLVLGTGLNAAASYQNRVLNTEMSFFGSSLAELLTPWDLEMQPAYRERRTAHLQLPLFQPMEYMCSGRYIGELFRIGVLDLAQKGQVFIGQRVVLGSAYELTGETICQIYEGSSDEISQIFAKYNVAVTEQDPAVLHSIIRNLITRAAAALASWLVAFCRVQAPRTHDTVRIGYIGSFLEHFAYYREQTQLFLDAYCAQNSDLHFDIRLIPHSTALGAAISASQKS
ncbi:hypothetical protein KL918_001789 [Ogataea parapolymorpha]|uniref:Phosphotransferase n=1 Tax=Ogataea parapolymorpha (strain ATCC 26012 / BCRC 20466 / JCM 22074 / NRRL Y-7560 / DL-1) TaxID=871575 RepID=W1QE27_OGAPD|nr:hexokinase [Ogataea parapolymorpha DL-1]ESW98820.1 hexokinase [Ogataea parapolymorpha DL-1]KAG7868131.1 hypothetical protein KL918_001789 [Ogataea parapolymorpha]KAG7874249.1 hypothetical protein KL916_001589 [Ogataea parapolymorpha]